LEVVWGDLVGRLADLPALEGGHVEQDAPSGERGDRVDAVRAVEPALEALDRRGAAVQVAVVGDVGQGVHVGADVGAEDDDVGRRRPAVRTDHVTVAPGVGVAVRRVVRRLGHPLHVVAGEVEDPRRALDGGDEVGRGRHCAPRGSKVRERIRAARSATGLSTNSPSTTVAASPRSWAARHAAWTFAAQTICSSDGAKARWTGSIWRGWMTDLPT